MAIYFDVNPEQVKAICRVLSSDGRFYPLERGEYPAYFRKGDNLAIQPIRSLIQVDSRLIGDPAFEHILGIVNHLLYR